jgi:hypothetical protein
MKTRPIDDAFFQGDALLLVEDELTRVVVTGCWSDDPAARKVVVRAVGGHSAVASLVQASREQGRRNVYGLIDRDFSTGSADAGPLLRTDWHEIENHLLDFDVLTSLHGRHTAADLRSFAQARASAMVAWMAARRTVWEMKGELQRFPADPDLGQVPDLDAAKAWIAALSYPQDIEASIRRTWTKLYLRDNRLPHHHANCDAEASSDLWLETFSGKEIFHHLVSRGGWRSGQTTPEALAYSIADRWTRAPARIPTFIEAMRGAIVRECALTA